MLTLFQIDKSGRDVFDKDYSIAIIVNKSEIYGINVSQEIKDMICKNISKKLPFLKLDDTIQAKFSKPSLIDSVAKSLREKNSSKYNVVALKINYDELFNLIKK